MKKLLVIAGPSGVGKTYLAEQLCKLYPENFESVKLFSTREPRSNEQFVDRIFITKEEFAAKQKNHEFMFDGLFHGNQYGYAKTTLLPTSKHLIVNAWPAYIPKFSRLPNVVLLGLTIEPSSLPLLQQRMLSRGNSPAQITERLQIIQRDMKDLERLKGTVQKHGKVFIITDDHTIPESVIPWLETTLLSSKLQRAKR